MSQIGDHRRSIASGLVDQHRPLNHREEIVAEPLSVESSLRSVHLLGADEVVRHAGGETLEGALADLPQLGVGLGDLLGEGPDETTLHFGALTAGNGTVHQAEDPLQRVFYGGTGVLETLALTGGEALQQHFPELFLALEVVEEAPLCDHSGGADLVHCRSHEALGQHELFRGVQQLVSSGRIWVLGSHRWLFFQYLPVGLRIHTAWPDGKGNSGRNSARPFRLESSSSRRKKDTTQNDGSQTMKKSLLKPKSKLIVLASLGAGLLVTGFVSDGPSWFSIQAERPAAASEMRVEAPGVAREMAAAASNFIAALDAAQRSIALYEIDDAERHKFHFFPIDRKGLPLKDLTRAQNQLAHAFLSTGLSHQGYVKAVTIMSLGEILRAMDGDKHKVQRDSDRFYFTIFGTPEPEGTWAWRVEGFHLSVNVTVIKGRWLVIAPSFFGSIPSTVKEGPRKGLQVLRNEEEMGRHLARALNAEQREIAFVSIANFEETVGGLVTGNTPRIERGTPVGIPAAKLTQKQKDILMGLVHEYAHRHRRELAEIELAKISRAGIDKIHFSWAGGLEPGQPHHYSIQGPDFLIEYDNSQDDANHVHTVWRDFDNDFGADLLQRHYQLHHKTQD